MQYALQAAERLRGIVTGPRMGKTTLINDHLLGLRPSDYLVATLVNTMLRANDILRWTAYEISVSMSRAWIPQPCCSGSSSCSPELYQDGASIAVVDEAQNLSLSAPRRTPSAHQPADSRQTIAADLPRQWRACVKSWRIPGSSSCASA